MEAAPSKIENAAMVPKVSATFGIGDPPHRMAITRPKQQRLYVGSVVGGIETRV